MGIGDSKNDSGRSTPQKTFRESRLEDLQRNLEKQKKESEANSRNLLQQSCHPTVENVRYDPGVARPFAPSRTSAAVSIPPSQNSHVKTQSPATIEKPLNNSKVTSNNFSSQPSSIERTRMPYSYTQTAQNQNAQSSDYVVQERLTSKRHTAGNTDSPQTKVFTPTTASELHPDLEDRESNLTRPNEVVVLNPSTSKESSYITPSLLSSVKSSDFVFVNENYDFYIRSPSPHKCVPSAPHEDFGQEPSRNNRDRSTSRCGVARSFAPSRASAAVTIPSSQSSHEKIQLPAPIEKTLNNSKITSNKSSPQLSSIDETCMPYIYNRSDLKNIVQNQNVQNRDYTLQKELTSTGYTAGNTDPPNARVLTPTTALKLYPDLEDMESNFTRPNELVVSNPNTSRGTSCVTSSPSSSQKSSVLVFVNKTHDFYLRSPSPHKSRVHKEGNRWVQKEGDELNCRTCHKKYGLVIYNCELGHSSCAGCKGRRCGVCGTNVTEVRNISFEAFIAKKKVPCINKKDGCIYILKMAEMEEHLNVCLFADLACPLSTVYGQCLWQGKISKMKSHFTDVHPQNRQAEIDKEMQLFNFVDNSRVVHLVDLGTYNFLFHLKVDKVEQKLYMCIQLIGTSSSARNWSYEVQVYNKQEPRRKYVQSDVCYSHGISLDVIFKESKCVAIPLAYVMGFVNEARLTYKFYIKKDVERFENRDRGRGRGHGRGRGRGAQAS